MGGFAPPSFLLVFAWNAQVRPGRVAAVLQQANQLRMNEQKDGEYSGTSLSARCGLSSSRRLITLNNNF